VPPLSCVIPPEVDLSLQTRPFWRLSPRAFIENFFPPPFFYRVFDRTGHSLIPLSLLGRALPYEP